MENEENIYPISDPIVPPKFYGLFVETRNSFFLSVQSAHSLEEAFSKARIEYEKTGNGPMGEARINLFTIKTLDEIRSPENFNPTTDQIKNTEEPKTISDFSSKELEDLTKSFERMAEKMMPGETIEGDIIPTIENNFKPKIKRIVRTVKIPLKKNKPDFSSIEKETKKISSELDSIIKSFTNGAKGGSLKDDKNRLMQEIIIKKDKKLFKQNMDNFSDAEREYIKTRLK